MRIGSLFTGAGGLDMAVEAFFDAETIWRSDIKPAACKLIEHYWPGTNLGDITAIDWAAVEPVDIITGGSPCQDMSQAGRRAGMKDGTRSGLWSYMRDAIETIRPAHVVWENVRGAYSAAADSNMEPCPWCVGDGSDVSLRACGRVLGDLAELGYDAGWVGLRAADVGAPHGRFRVFILATDTQNVGHERGRRAWNWRPGPANGRHLATDRDDRQQREQAERGIRPEPGGGSATAADTEGIGRVEGWTEPAGQQRGSGAAVRSAVDWGQYTPAIRRWEAILGRPAPHPTVTGPKGGQRLSPDLTDWMMGWPEGWTDVPNVTRAERLSMGGDGVVPQQAFEALRRLSSYSVERAA